MSLVLKTTTDDFLGGLVKIKQPEKGYRAGIDAVLLASAINAKPGQIILDLGCGVGTAGICALNRTPEAQLIGIDIQDDLINLAQENAKENKIEHSVDYILGDIRDKENWKENYFDHVMINPPYMSVESHFPSPNDIKATANGELEKSPELADWIKSAYINLKHGGYLTMIYRSDRMDEAISVIRERFGSIVILPLWPMQNVEAKRVIISARKNKNAPMRILPGLVLHNKDGSYTKKITSILKNGDSIGEII